MQSIKAYLENQKLISEALTVIGTLGSNRREWMRHHLERAVYRDISDLIRQLLELSEGYTGHNNPWADQTALDLKSVAEKLAEFTQGS